VTVDRVAEAVLDRHLGDLAQTTEVALLRAGRHDTSLARQLMKQAAFPPSV
jgi:hypothetical protein